MLLDPADAENFRMTKDSGRFYIDPLPADDIAPATDAEWPSCSAVKKASEKDWSFLVTPRMAAIEPDELRRIAGLEQTRRLAAFKEHETVAKQTAFGRGSIIHLWKEDLLAGRQPREITDVWLTVNKYPRQALEDAKQYLPAILDFFDVYQPEPVVVEYVTIHRTLNGHGYGATPDALVRMEGEVVALDWKTRSDGSQHAAYAEELAQVSCGARAEYMVVRDGGQAVRKRLPDTAGGYVVSIKTDGARLYPLDLDLGWDYWCHLHEWWVHQQTAKAGVGRILPAKRANKIAATVTAETRGQQAEGNPKAPSATGEGVETSKADGLVSAPEPAPNRAALKLRYKALTPTLRQQFRDRGLHPSDLDGISRLLDELENPPSMRALAEQRMATDTKPPRTPTPDEGADILSDDFSVFKARYDAMPDGARKWVGTLIGQALTAGVDFRGKAKPTKRRFELYRGLINLGHWLNEEANDEVLGALVYAAAGGDAAADATLFANVTPGHALGSLDYQEAAAFANMVDDLIGGRSRTVVNPDGALRLEAA